VCSFLASLAQQLQICDRHLPLLVSSLSDQPIRVHSRHCVHCDELIVQSEDGENHFISLKSKCLRIIVNTVETGKIRIWLQSYYIDYFKPLFVIILMTMA